MSVTKEELLKSLNVVTDIFCFLSTNHIATSFSQIRRILTSTPSINANNLVSDIRFLQRIAPDVVQLREIWGEREPDFLLNFVGDFSISRSNISLIQNRISQIIENCVSDGSLNLLLTPIERIEEIEVFDHDNRLIPDRSIAELRRLPFYHDQICSVQPIAARAPQYSQLRSRLSPDLLLALNYAIFRGPPTFYNHQATAIDAILLENKHLVISTSASSGKSMVFNVAVLSEVINNSSSVSLYIHPTKGLTQDQFNSLMEIVNSNSLLRSRVCCRIFDGDHPDLNYRKEVRESSNIILVNPDIIHATILPNHKDWKRVFQNLKFIVLDEAHIYSGLFGTHVSAVIKRLLRICMHYNASPRFICCSATMDNPQVHFLALVPMDYVGSVDQIEVISDAADTSPKGEKSLVVWNPSAPNVLTPQPDVENPRKIARREEERKEINDEDAALELEGRGLSAIQETIMLFVHLVKRQIKTICFCPVRFLVELVYSRACSILGPTHSHLIPKICAYRAGYEAAARRRIEHEMLNGRLIGIVATNALELGIDIGNLDCSLHLGFPGSYCSFWQQIGRSGRSGRPSLSIMVCFEDPANQFLARNPTLLTDRRNIEASCFEEFNVHVMKSHLVYAAKELSIPQLFTGPSNKRLDDAKMFCGSNDKFRDLVRELGDRLVISNGASAGLYQNKGRVKQIGLRNMEEEVSVVDEATGQEIDSYMVSLAIMAVYPGGIVRVSGKQYLVKSLDIFKRIAVVNEVKVWYFTKPLDIAHADLTRVCSSFGNVQHCQVHISITVPKFVKVSPITLKTAEIVFCNVPTYAFDSIALVIEIPHRICDNIGIDATRLGTHALNHALQSLVKTFSKCDWSNLGTEHELLLMDSLRVIVFDWLPGGFGACTCAYQKRDLLMQQLFQLIFSCPCESGCPRCIHSFQCPIFNERVSKESALEILRQMME